MVLLHFEFEVMHCKDMHYEKRNLKHLNEAGGFSCSNDIKSPRLTAFVDPL